MKSSGFGSEDWQGLQFKAQETLQRKYLVLCHQFRLFYTLFPVETKLVSGGGGGGGERDFKIIHRAILRL